MRIAGNIAEMLSLGLVLRTSMGRPLAAELCPDAITCAAIAGNSLSAGCKDIAPLERAGPVTVAH